VVAGEALLKYVLIPRAKEGVDPSAAVADLTDKDEAAVVEQVRGLCEREVWNRGRLCRRWGKVFLSVVTVHVAIAGGGRRRMTTMTMAMMVMMMTAAASDGRGGAGPRAQGAAAATATRARPRRAGMVDGRG
jgi:hypothetical protein